MKITEYPQVAELDSSNVFIIDGDNGTKQIKGTDLAYALFDGIPEMHNQIYRGKNLGSSFTSEQSNNIKDGSFHDLWLGDYWEIGHNKYRIVDFDYYYHYCGTPRLSTHHVVIMPDGVMMNSTGDTFKTSFSGSGDLKATGYRGAAIRSSSEMGEVKTLIKRDFGSSHVLPYKIHASISFTKSSVDGLYYASNSWMDAEVEIPSMNHIYGHPETGVARAGSEPFNQQFSLFKIKHSFISGSDLIPDGEDDFSKYSYWTRTVESSEFVTSQAGAIYDIGGDGAFGTLYGNSSNCGIRPYFLVS